MEEKQRADVINFSWGSLPIDALDQRTLKELQIIADRHGMTIEQVMSQALDWVLGTRDQRTRQT
jgi:hypothetical protein